MQFFYPQDLEESAESKRSPLSITQLLKNFHAGDRNIDVARRDVIRVLMPTEGVMEHPQRKYKLQEFTQTNIDALYLRLQPLRDMYHDGDTTCFTAQRDGMSGIQIATSRPPSGSWSRLKRSSRARSS
mmetsp:Transcript_33861/g.71032  ORF Transcript_33861/g.71032 Transcript_33861/m.71032 type:complete len:128 (-) Transcript_33861:555-938(-)